MHVIGTTAIAFDPSYFSKAGKKTPGVGYFWSGCAGKSKWGLGFCGLAILDLTRRTAFIWFQGFGTMPICNTFSPEYQSTAGEQNANRMEK